MDEGGIGRLGRLVLRLDVLGRGMVDRRRARARLDAVLGLQLALETASSVCSASLVTHTPSECSRLIRRSWCLSSEPVSAIVWWRRCFASSRWWCTAFSSYGVSLGLAPRRTSALLRSPFACAVELMVSCWSRCGSSGRGAGRLVEVQAVERAGHLIDLAFSHAARVQNEGWSSKGPGQRAPIQCFAPLPQDQARSHRPLAFPLLRWSGRRRRANSQIAMAQTTAHDFSSQAPARASPLYRAEMRAVHAGRTSSGGPPRSTSRFSWSSARQT